MVAMHMTFILRATPDDEVILGLQPNRETISEEIVRKQSNCMPACPG